VTNRTVAERQPSTARRNFTLIAYLTFVSHGAHKSEESRQHSRETSQSLMRLLDYLRDHVDGVRSVRMYKHALGGLVPVGRGHPPTQVMVEVSRLSVLDGIRTRAAEPGVFHDLLEKVRERVDTCATEVVYEAPMDV
jgi:hypothetical protein